jgi:ABC-type transport system substrate-binding protein
MKKTIWIFAVSFAIFTLFLGSFAVSAKPKGKFTIASSQGTMELRSVYDPHTAVGATPTTFKSMIFDSLSHRDLNGKVIPALATDWEIGTNWSHMTFNIRRGVKFHNGDSLTAADVKYSIERAMREDIRFVFGGEMRRLISSVETMGDFKVKINLKGPYLAFFDRCFDYLAIVPKNYTEKVGDKGFAKKPVGTGPFKMAKFARDRYLDGRAVENHYRKTPYVRDVHYMNVKEHSTRLAMLKTGEADMVMLLSTHIPNVKRDKKLRIIWSRHTYLITMVFFDLAHPEDSPFKDIRVRKATRLAIDLRGIADAVSFGAQEPWGSFLAPYHLGYDTNQQASPYDPEKAKKLMVEAGYAKGFDTTMTVHPSHPPRFEPMIAMLKKIGIRVKMRVPEAGTWSKMFVGAKFRGIGYGSGPWWVGRGHPASALNSHITGGWNHKLATPAIYKAMSNLEVAVGDDNIAAKAKILNDQIFTDLIRFPLWSSHVAFAVNQRVKAYPAAPGTVFPRNFEYLELND